MSNNTIKPVPYREQLEKQIRSIERNLKGAYDEFKKMEGNHPDWFLLCSKINNLSVDLESARSRLECLGSRRYLPDSNNISDYLKS